MRPLGPTDAFQPAIDRTRAILARPFRLGRSWKLAFCAYLALSGSLFVPLPLAFLLFPHLPFPRVFWLLSAAFTALLFGFFYLGSRMQVVLFDLVLTLDGRIASLWRLRRPSLIWRWIAIKLAITLPLALIILMPLGSAVRRLFALFPHAMAIPGPTLGSPAPALDPHLLLAVFSLYAILFAAMALLFFASSLLSDFVLPVLALELSSVRVVLRRALSIVRVKPAAVLGFVAFQGLLAAVGLIAQYTVASILTCLVAIALGLVAWLGYLALHTIASTLLLTVAGVILYAAFLLISMYLQLGSFGTLMIFLRCYSLLFLAGYYAPLGDLLYPATLPSIPSLTNASPPPPFPLPHPSDTLGAR